MKKITFLILFCLVPVVCLAQDTVTQASPEWSGQTNAALEENKNLTECEKAGGNVVQIEECDGSKSDWCIISAKEQCYADQVKDGHCTAGHYDEELKGIVGISPKVLCDSRDSQ